MSRCRGFPWHGGGPSGGLCPHKWLPGSAVAHLPLIPTPGLTFASSFLCSSFPPPPSPTRQRCSSPRSVPAPPSFSLLAGPPSSVPPPGPVLPCHPRLCLLRSVPLSRPVSSSRLPSGGTRVHHGLREGNRHAYLFLDIFGRPRDIHHSQPRISNEARRCFFKGGGEGGTSWARDRDDVRPGTAEEFLSGNMNLMN